MMLVLERKQGESIHIGDITIKCCKIQAHRVQLGITAPSHVNILRSEIAERLKKTTPSNPLKS
jgi:carbon storage regulator CsrA